MTSEWVMSRIENEFFQDFAFDLDDASKELYFDIRRVSFENEACLI